MEFLFLMSAVECPGEAQSKPKPKGRLVNDSEIASSIRTAMSQLRAGSLPAALVRPSHLDAEDSDAQVESIPSTSKACANNLALLRNPHLATWRGPQCTLCREGQFIPLDAVGQVTCLGQWL